jgi:ferredoxin-NADP reductase
MLMEEEKEHMTTVATPPVTTARLLSRHEVAEGTMAFRFERPSNWTFKAGQYLDMTLLDPPETDSEGDVRSFSIASGPHEETLMVATRMRDTAFKRLLRTMPLGTAVKIEGPSGDLTFPESFTRASVFLAGGIGITPFRSMICLAAAERLPHQIFLFYSNRRPEDAPLLAELESLERDNPKYKLIASMTEMAKSHRSWSGETGFINQEMLGRYLKGVASPIYYVAGPPAMVKGLHEMLNKAGMNDDDIRAEEFAGY